MSAVQALALARAAGIRVSVEGDDLALMAQAPPSDDVLDLLAQHKAAVVRLLVSGGDEWTAADWRQFFPGVYEPTRVLLQHSSQPL